MIQQKKIHTNFSLNYFHPYTHQQMSKKTLNVQPKQSRSKKNSSIVSINESHHFCEKLNNDPHQNVNKSQKCKVSHNVSQKTASKPISQNQKNKRKTSKSHINISSSVLVLTHNKENQNRMNSKEKRKSLLKFQNPLQMNVQHQNQEAKKILKGQKQQKVAYESKKIKDQASRQNIFSLKKNKNKDKTNEIERKKHSSCASIIQRNPKSKSRSKSKSKSKSKEKKGKKRHSFKFNKINLNKENEPRNKNIATQSIQKEFKQITKKLEKQLDMKHKKSIKSTKQIGGDLLCQIQKKKSKVSNKQSNEPGKKKSRMGISMNNLLETFSPTIQIRKQPPNCQRKFSQKIEVRNAWIGSQKKQEQKPSQCYFLIKKNQTPQSSNREFPVNKYIEPTIGVDVSRSKRHSFQKTVKQNRRKSFIHDKEALNNKSPLEEQNVKNTEQTKIDNRIKSKAKKASKSKNQSNISCLYAETQKLGKKIAKQRSSSVNDQYLTQKSPEQQMQFSYKTEKIRKPKGEEVKQENQGMKKCFHAKEPELPAQISEKSRKKALQDENRVVDSSQQTFLQHGVQSFNQSLNIQEIRYYESISPSYRQQVQFIPISNTVAVYDHQSAVESSYEPKIFEKCFMNRAIIVSELKDEYPLLSKKELQFLASICFIQRKWKEVLLARKINDFISLKNTSELFVKSKTNVKSLFENQDKSASNVMTSVMMSKSQMKNLTTQSQNTQTQEALLTEHQQHPIDLIPKKSATKRQQEGKIQEPQQKASYEFEQQEKHEQQEEVCHRFPFQQQDIFPDISYLKTKKYLQKRKLVEGLTELHDAYKSNKISLQEHELKKKEFEQAYKQSVKEINATKKAIKKGYLKYIETLKTVNQSLVKAKEQKPLRSSRKGTPSKILKRVNSEESVLGEIYKKIFKLDQLSSDNGSELSGQTKRLNEAFLIRKSTIPHHIERSLQLRYFNGLGKNLGSFKQENFIYTERNKQRLKTYEQEQNLNKKPLSTREMQSIQFGGNRDINFEEDTKIIFEEEDATQDRKQQTHQYIGNEESEQATSDFLQRQGSPNVYNISELLKSESLKAYNISELLLSQDELNCLGESPIQNLNKNLQNSPEALLQLKKVTHQEFIFSERRQQRQNEDESQHKQVIQPFEKQCCEDEIDNICFSLDQNQEDFNEQMPSYVSPVSSTMSMANGANVASKDYLKGFVQYLKKSNDWKQIILQGLNTPQGFTPISYLRFIREFEIPDDEYSQIIPNEVFFEWEDEPFLTKNEISSEKSIKKAPKNILVQEETWKRFSFNQFKGIQHRCLYDLFNSQIQTFRVYGQKGKPFPWQVGYSVYQPPLIGNQKVDRVLDKCLQRCICNVLGFSCGIILQNHPDILTEQDLQELHDKNEDAIIDMIEGELVLEKHAWYEFEEHSLQTNFEISQLVWNEIVNQFINELCIKRKTKSFTL